MNYQPLKKRLIFAILLTMMVMTLLLFAARAGAQTQSIGPLTDIDRTANKVAENSPSGALASITVYATGATSYILTDSAGGLFAINRQKGTVTVNRDMLDYEAFSFHTIIVQASNATTRRARPFTIQVTDVKEPLQPVTDIDPTPNKISYGSALGDTVGLTARAVDPDRGSEVRYSLSEDANGLFAIGRQDGVVILASDNYDPDQDYRIEVTARSNDNTSSAAQFTVRLDEPIRIAPPSMTPTIEEGESQGVNFSFTKTDLELIAVSIGGNHSCGLTADNDAVCWGGNAHGRSSPPTNRKFIAISAGDTHNCGITPGNDAVCWGSNLNSSGNQVGKSMPPSGRKFIAIAAGLFHSCGITFDNEAVCWGDNAFGQSAPPEGLKFIAIGAGSETHTCGITFDNEAVCWGSNAFGQSAPPEGLKFIAIDSTIGHSCGITLDNKAVCWGFDSEEQNALIPDRKLLAIGTNDFHTCAITTENDAVCWGSNRHGRSAPPAGRKFIAITAGRIHSCGITTDNKAVCWGSNGDGKSTPPQLPPVASDSIAITATVSDADREQLSVAGNGRAVIPAGKTQIALTFSVADDSINEPETDHTITLSVTGHAELARDEMLITIPADDGDTKTIGDIDNAKNTVAENSPVGAEVGIMVHAANTTNYTLTDNAGGRFAINNNGLVTVDAGGLLDFEEATAHSIIAQASGSGFSRTIRLSIQLTDVPEPLGSVVDTDSNPNKISYGAMRGDAVGITARAVDPDRGSMVSYRLSEDEGGLFIINRQDGVVTLASDDYDAERAHFIIEVTAMSNDNTSRVAQFIIRPDSPVRIAPSPMTSMLREGESQNITFSFAETGIELGEISAGSAHTCAITSANDAVCWGDNNFGKSSPPAGRKFLAIGAGDSHSCGITTNNDAVCWGANNFGESSPPTGRKFIAIDTAGQYTCAITVTNDAVCWGRDNNGQSSPPSGRKFIAISGILSHTCGITTDNDALCWGFSAEGATVPPSGRKFIAIGAGSAHSCGITTNNEAVCWGNNGNNRSTPPANRKFIAIDAGRFHTCGITPDNDAVCWGWDGHGQSSPPLGRKFIAISAGFEHSCAIALDNGEAVCWGSHANGRSTPPKITPAGADFPITITATVSDADREQLSIAGNGQAVISAGSTQVALSVSATDDDIGEPQSSHTIDLSVAGRATLAADQIAVTVPADSRDIDFDSADNAVAENSPVGAAVGITMQVENTTAYTLIDSAGGRFAIDPQSGVVSAAINMLDHEAFPSHNIIAQAGNAASSLTAAFTIQVTDVDEPVGPVIDIDFNLNEIGYQAMRGDAVGITARATDPDQGSAVSYSLSADSTGLFIIGQQGGVVILASDNYDPDQDYSIEVTAMSDDGTSSAAQFTIGPDEPIRIASSPTALTLKEGESQVITLSFTEADLEVKEVNAGRFHNCVITSGDEGVCWGSNIQGSTRPPKGKKFIAIRAGLDHSCGITASNDAVCWGSDVDGQSSPPPGRKFIAISAGDSHSCGITTNNDAVCWGDDGSGRATPTTGRKYIAISAGILHTCALTTDNDAVCWGSDNRGRSSPPSDRKLIAISAGSNHTCGITPDNDAVCWGSDTDGQSSPPPGRKFIAIGAGAIHTCGITASHEALCWGSNLDDQGVWTGQSAPPAGRKFIAVSAGQAHSCGITASNKVACWGGDFDLFKELAGQSSPPQTFTPTAAGPTAINAAISDADRGQISLSDDGQIVIPAGETQATLAVIVTEDGLIEPEASYTIDLSAAGHTELEQDELIVTVPADDGDTIRDTDGRDNTIAENSPAGAAVGITMQVENTTNYTLTDSAGGLFAIDPQSGVVSVAIGMLDHEAFPSHNIIAQAGNAASNLIAAFTIQVTDVAESLRSITDIDLSPNEIAYQAMRGDAVGITARAVDPDRGSVVSYSLSGNPESLFAIGEQDGVVTLASDNYNPEQSYSIEVTARSDDNTSSTVQFTIRADNEPPIRIALDPTTATLPEGERVFISFSLPETKLKIKEISAGSRHNCAITASNNAACWGSNSHGQSFPPQDEKFIAISAAIADTSHGCGITPGNDAVCWGDDGHDQATPITGRKYIAITAGDLFTCAITTDNDAVCWGTEDRDQIIPPSGRKFIAISSGFDHTCAITTGNDAVCWGSDDEGRSSPPSDRKFIAIAAGDSYSCSLTLDNDAVCWGLNSSGQSSPPSGRKFIAISAGGSHTCGITASNDAVCWGFNSHGQSSPPQDEKFIAISAGARHSCAITTSNDAVCWGSSSSGQSTPPQTFTPTAADPITINAAVSDAGKGQIEFNKDRITFPAGERADQVLLAEAVDDGVKESTTDYIINFSVSAPAELEQNQVVITVPADDGDTIEDSDGALGGMVAENSPVGAEVGLTVKAPGTVTYTLTDSVGGLFVIDTKTGVVSVAMDALDYEAFSFHIIRVEVSSSNDSQITPFTIQVTDVNETVGRIADIDFNPNKIVSGAMRGTPVGITARAVDPDRGSMVSYSLSENPESLFAIGGQDGVVSLASGNYDPDQNYSIEVTARSDDGSSSAAQFTVRRDDLVRVALAPVASTLREGESQDITFSLIQTGLELIAISAGGSHSCGITPDNKGVCWGDDAYEQSSMPSDRKLIAISSGVFHSCAITADNDAACWGNDGGGRATPTTGKEFIAISAGELHSCGITSDNDAVCWGSDTSGSTMPPANQKFIAISAGGFHTCAITTANDALCWGSDKDAEGESVGQSMPPSNRKFIAISAGDRHTCAITTGNDALCWGGDKDAEGESVGQSMPPSGNRFVAISAGGFHTCAITTGNDALCWGGDKDAEGESVGQSMPPSGRKFIAISSGLAHTCALTVNNETVCWGGNENSFADLVGQSSPSQVIPDSADPITITATISDADKGQISLSDNGQIVIPAGETQTILTVTVTEDGIREPETRYTIPLSATGHTRFDHDEIIITVPVNERDITVDADSADNIVAENSPIDTAVGITVEASNAVHYTLADSASGLFAIGRQSGIVTVAMEALDHEALSFHTIVVEVMTQAAANSTAAFTIQVADVPEPIGFVTDINFSPNKISHSSTRGDTVGITARAVDPDRGSTVSYSLSEDADGLFAIGRQDGIVTLASGNYDPDQDHRIEVTAMSGDNTSSAAQFTIRRDEPIRITLRPATSILEEGTSQVITFFAVGEDLELRSVSAGRSHSCAITSDGRAVCWGDNDNGQSVSPAGRKFIAASAGGTHSCGLTAGNDAVCWGSDESGRSAPPSGEKFIAISAGGTHSCGITADNRAVCWGSGLFEQSMSPEGGRFIAISAGHRHSCGLTADNRAVCWGDNENGQSAPPSDRKFIAASAGGSHSCGITLDNKVVCWGHDLDGQTTPTTDRKFIAISAGQFHSCGITADNAAVCWGNNDSEQTIPTPGKKFIAVSAGGRHSCGITSDNGVACWGANNERQRTPPQIPPLAANPVTVTATIAGPNERQFSFSDKGQAVISVGSTQTPLTVGAVDDDVKEPRLDYTIDFSVTGHAELERDQAIITILADDRDTLDDINDSENRVAENSPAGSPAGITVQADGATAYTLSDDADGLFAINMRNGIVTVADALDYEAFSSHTITAQAITSAATLTIPLVILVSDVPEPLRPIADIDFNPNQIVFGAMRGTPVGITARAVDPDHGSVVRYMLREDAGGLFTVGQQDGVVALASDNYDPERNYRIEVTARSDDGTSQVAQFTVRPDEPIRIALHPTTATLEEGQPVTINFSFAKRDFKVKGISAGSTHTCAITPDSRAVCWGSNANGRSAPPTNRKFSAVSAGSDHTCAITTDNDAVCWGSNVSGQTTPTASGKFIAVSAGNIHTCGITANNEAGCWGSNSSGQRTPPPDRKFIAISSGGAHTCGVTISNDAVCWGDNASRQSAPPANRKFIAIGAGFRHSCGITTDNDAVCWGSNGNGRSAPPANRKLIAVSAGFSHTCAISADNDAVCWGSNGNGRSAPPSNRKFIALSAWESHTCGITPDNDAVCWGSNQDAFTQLVNQSSPPRTIAPVAAAPTIINAAILDEGRGQISLSDNGQVIIPAGETQAALTVTAGDDDIREPETDYIIPLSATGHIALEEDELIITVPVDDGDTQVIGDIDDTDNEVAESSPTGTKVGIIVYAGTATATLLEDANGRFAIDDTGLVTVADGNLLNYEEATSHNIIVEAGNADRSTTQLTIQVINVNEITLADTDDADNTASSTAGATVAGLMLKATHADEAPITEWEITTQTSASNPSTPVDLFEFSEPAKSSDTRTLRIKADADLTLITAPMAFRVSVRARTAFDATDEDFDIRVFPETSAAGIRLRVRVYLEGALE